MMPVIESIDGMGGTGGPMPPTKQPKQRQGVHPIVAGAAVVAAGVLGYFLHQPTEIKVYVPVPGPKVEVPGPTVVVPGPTVYVPVPGPKVEVPGPTVYVDKPYPVPGPTKTIIKHVIRHVPDTYSGAPANTLNHLELTFAPRKKHQ